MTAPAIPLFRSTVSEAARAALLRTIDSHWLGYGPQCLALERAFTQGRGGFALATSSCTAALHLAGRLIRSRCEPGAEVIVPAISFVASATAFLEAGLRPVVADVDPGTLLLDPAAVRRAITPRTRAIVAVHLYGQRHDGLAALRDLADSNGLTLIEDCAHRIDLRDAAPPLGDLLCYSFNAVKELPCGEGGLLWGRDPRDEPLLRAASNHGLGLDTLQRSATARHADCVYGMASGLKLRGNDIAASLALAMLPDLATARAERHALFARYDALLAPVHGAAPLARHADDSALMYVVKTSERTRERARTRMAAAGIATSVHYASLARHPLFGHLRAGAGCGDQDACILTLPTYAGLSADDQARVIDALEQALEPVLHAGAANAHVAPPG